MELATGGELFDRVAESKKLTERAVAPYFRGMVEGLLHCLARGVVHRHIKLEDVMLCAEEEGCRVNPKMLAVQPRRAVTRD